jgi:NADH-quinone oxidoreductase subunit J
MLTRAPIGRSTELDAPHRWPAVLVAVGAAATLLTVVVDAFHATYLDLDKTDDGSARATGESLFRAWVLPFEVLSVLLLAALIGAIILSRTRGQDPEKQAPEKQQPETQAPQKQHPENRPARPAKPPAAGGR